MHDEVKAPAPVERRAAASEQALGRRSRAPAGFVDESAGIAREDWDPANGAKVVSLTFDADFEHRLPEERQASCR